jgi:fermentation-respiration switch protein FrsA (DUF1100 family)
VLVVSSRLESFLMRKLLKTVIWVAAILLVLAFILAFISSRYIANDMLHDPYSDREPITQTPADFGVPFEAVMATSASGVELAGWYVPSQNGAAVILQHGYEENRQHMLEEAKMLHDHEYGALISTVRGHDLNGEGMITFGCYEMEDLDAWYQFLLERDEVDPEHIGILGQSMGGSLAIQYAYENEQIKSVVAHSPLTSLEDTIDIGLRHFSPIPDPLVPLLSPLIIFWGEQIAGCDLEDVNAEEWIGAISPRPVYLICGGKDDLVIEQNCRSLYAQSREPVTFWFEETCDHHECDTVFPEEFESRIIGFFDQYLLESPPIE